MEFLFTTWLYAAFALIGALLMYVFMERKKLSFNKIISLVGVVSLPLHMFEERVFPGGFSYIYQQMTGIEQTQLIMIFCNAPAVLILAIVWWKKGEKAWFVLFTTLLATVEFILHTVEAVTGLQLFKEAGMLILYSPGYLTTIVCMMPAAVIGFVHLLRTKQLTKKELLKGVGFTFLVAFGMVFLPNLLFNGSGYPFPNAGYYEQFLMK